MRARILAVIPGDIVDAAVAACRATMAGNSEVPLADRIRALVSAFALLGVSTALIEKRFNRKTGDLLPEDLVDLRGIYKSLKDGMSKASDWFGDASGTAAESSVAAVVNKAVDAARQPQQTQPTAQPEPAPVTQAEPAPAPVTASAPAASIELEDDGPF